MKIKVNIIQHFHLYKDEDEDVELCPRLSSNIRKSSHGTGMKKKQLNGNISA